MSHAVVYLSLPFHHYYQQLSNGTGKMTPSLNCIAEEYQRSIDLIAGVRNVERNIFLSTDSSIKGAGYLW